MSATLLRSQFRINKKNLSEAVRRLKEWASNCLKVESPISFYENHGFNYQQFQGLENPRDVFQVFGWDLRFDDGYADLVQRHCENTDENYEAAMSTLVGLVEPGSYLVFHGDDDDLFRWTWRADAFHVYSGGSIIFDAEPNVVYNVPQEPGVEAVALALYHNNAGMTDDDYVATYGKKRRTWPELAEHERDDFRTMAKAAIQVMVGQ